MSDNLKAQLEAERRKRKELADSSTGSRNISTDIKFDTDIYTSDKFAGYDTSIDTHTAQDTVPPPATGRFGITAPRELIDELNGAGAEEEDDPFKAIQRARGVNRVIADRESDYQKRRHDRQLSPDHAEGGVSYSEVMRKNQLDREKADLLAKIKKAQDTAEEKRVVDTSQPPKRRWDVETPVHPSSAVAATPKRNRWDQTPADVGAVAATPRRNRWDETPQTAPGTVAFGETPKRVRSKWDETPAMISGSSAIDFGATPAGNIGLATPSAVQMTAGNVSILAKQSDVMDARNVFQTDEELDSLLPKDGYMIMEPPPTYIPIRTPARKLMATPAPLRGSEGFLIQEESRHADYDIPKEVPGVGALPFFKQDDMQFFGKLLDGQSEEDLDVAEKRERQVLRLLLKIKNGTPPMRKVAMRQIAERAREFGAAPIFNQTLPLLMSPSLEEQERHLLVKVIDRVMFRLGDLVRPFVHKILVVIEPMLIDEDRYARSEGCEIISNLAKAAGLPAMIATMRPDIDHVDEYVRNTTARALSVVASALGIPALLPFLKA
ncbi:U2 snRNP component prp10, partial [Coemansia sp. S100]